MELMGSVMLYSASHRLTARINMRKPKKSGIDRLAAKQRRHVFHERLIEGDHRSRRFARQVRRVGIEHHLAAVFPDTVGVYVFDILRTGH